MEREKKVIRRRICKNKWILKKLSSRNKVKANNRKNATHVFSNDIKANSNTIDLDNWFPKVNIENGIGLSCESDFDDDGELRNAIQTKLKALSCKSKTNEYVRNSRTLISKKEKGIHTFNSEPSTFIKSSNESILSTVPSIFTDNFLETSQDSNVDTNHSISVLTLFSNSNKSVGDVEVIEWKKNYKRKRNFSAQNDSVDEELSNSYHNGESREFNGKKSRTVKKTENRKERLKESRNSRTNLHQSTMIQNKQLKLSHTVDSTEKICLDTTDASECSTNKSIIRLIHLEQEFCIIVLTYPNKLYFYGKVKALGLHGSIEVLGYRLNEDFQDIYSARTGCALCFETCIANDSACLFRKLRNLGVSIIKSEEIATRVRPNDGVLVLKPLENTLTYFISKHCKRFDPFSRNGLPAEILFYEAEEMLKSNLFTDPPKQYFSLNSLWRDISANIHHQCITLIAGGKNAGKSTFLRYYVNRSLASQKSIAVIDLDPGQSEFTIATSISVTIVQTPLLGANFTHLQNSTRMYTIGVVNVMDNLELYVSAVKNLFEYCKNDRAISDLPWVINTMGLTDDTGLHLMSYILTLAKPDIVIQLENKNNFPIPLQPSCLNKFVQNNNGNRLFTSSNVEKDIKHIKYKYLSLARDEALQAEGNPGLAKHERFLNILSYFSQIEADKNCNILAVRPFAVPKEAITIATTSFIPDENIASVINGKLVALCSSNSVEVDGSKVQLLEENLVTYGYGLIRAVDPDRKCIYLNTPVKNDIMVKVDTLVYLECLPDLCSINEKSFEDDVKIPYSAPISINIKQRKLLKTPQRRFNLLQLLKMKSAVHVTQ